MPPSLPNLYIDHTRVRQVLLNILANACRFTAEGEVKVSATVHADEVIISVSDTGPGLPSDELAVIFEEFRQSTAPAPTGEKVAGKGLGLAIAKHFVHLHGGRIWAENRDGQGSIFSFSLPLTPKQVGTLAPPTSQQATSGSASPLVVLVGGADEQAFLERRLEGYHIVAATDLGEARKLVREGHPHAVILNVPPEPEEAQQGVALVILPEPVPLLQCSLPVGCWLMEPELFDDWLVKPIDVNRLEKALASVQET
ncbi:MAG: ATP-binding protein, partial [Anaerolineae bacterium]